MCWLDDDHVVADVADDDGDNDVENDRDDNGIDHANGDGQSVTTTGRTLTIMADDTEMSE